MSSERNLSEIRKVREQFTRSRIAKYSSELLLRTLTFTMAVSSGNADKLKHLKDPEHTSGLIEGAVIADRLCFPAVEAAGELVLKQGSAGRWLGYDFKRPDEFPIAARRGTLLQEFEGQMLYADLADRNTNDPSHRTPTTPINVYSIDHILSISSPSLDYLTEGGFLVRRSHEQAYEIAGAVELIGGLRSRGVADLPVYQITPRGNSLIMLAPDGGDATPKEDRQPEFSPARIPGLLTH